MTHFTGKERDSESGLDNFGARYDSSSMGRFMSPDPESSSGYDNPDDPQGWNAYSYARNNPVNFTDPDGRDYRVCVDNGNGGQNCTTYANLRDLQKAAAASGATQSGTTTETYDPVGSRLTSLGVANYTNNTSNELTSTSNATYTYDYNGNTLTKTDSTGTTSYVWDYENRLTSVTLPGSGGTVTFKYDPFGKRIYKSSSAATSIYAYDGENLVEEVNSSGTVVARYSDSLNIDEPLAMLRSGATSFYNADGLGTITSLANSAGSLAQTYTFDSFGKQTASSGSLTNPFQYTARESDSETGLYYYRARYYVPGTGRFISEDPLRFKAGPNFYIYVGNNSTSRIDPSGLDPDKCPKLSCEQLRRECFWQNDILTAACYQQAHDDFHKQHEACNENCPPGPGGYTCRHNCYLKYLPGYEKQQNTCARGTVNRNIGCNLRYYLCKLGI